MQSAISKLSRDRQTGNVVIIFALMLVVLLGFSAIAIDIGNLFKVRSELQNAVDAACMAGAVELDRTMEGIERARDKVKNFGQEHYANTTTVSITDEDIIFGHWYPSGNAPCGQTPCFQPFGPSPSPELVSAVNAVQARARRPHVQMHFARFLGIGESAVSALGTAVGGCPARECGFPMVVADCALDKPVEDGTCLYCMKYQNNNDDTAGWTSFSENGLGSAIPELITSACGSKTEGFLVDESSLECTGACHSSTMGEEIQVYNGNTSKFCELVHDILMRNGPGMPAKAFKVRVPVLLSTPGSDCDASQFSSQKPVAGYAVLEIFGAKCGKGKYNIPAIAPNAPHECSEINGSETYVPPPSENYIVGRLLCGLKSANPGGGGCYGLETNRSRLVE